MFLSKAISNSCRHRTPLIFTRPSQCVQTFSSDAKDDEIDPQTAQKMVEYVQQKAMQTGIVLYGLFISSFDCLMIMIHHWSSYS